MKKKAKYYGLALGLYLAFYVVEYLIIGFFLLLLNDSVLLKFVLLAICAGIINPICVYRLLDVMIERGWVLKDQNPSSPK